MPAKIKVAPPDLRTDWAEAEWWAQLARERKLRLPLWRMRCTQGQMRRWLKKLGLDYVEYLYWWCGDQRPGENLKSFTKKNPDVPLRVWVGLLLEYQWDKADRALRREKEAAAASAPPRKRGRPKKAVPVAEGA